MRFQTFQLIVQCFVNLIFKKFKKNSGFKLWDSLTPKSLFYFTSPSRFFQVVYSFRKKKKFLLALGLFINISSSFIRPLPFSHPFNIILYRNSISFFFEIYFYLLILYKHIKKIFSSHSPFAAEHETKKASLKTFPGSRGILVVYKVFFFLWIHV